MVLIPPTALWAIPVSDLAGVARHALDVARSGIPGWRVVFLTPPGNLPARLREVGAAVVEGQFGPEHGIRESVATLRHAVRTLRPMLVHSHLSYADIVAAMVVRGPRLVTTEHGIARDDLVYHHSRSKARVMATVHTTRLRRFDAAIAVSHATAEAMRRKWQPRIPLTVIPNGIDVTPREPRAPGLRILSLARLAPEKRLSLLLDGFAELRRTHPEATLTLAGTGPEEHALRAHVHRLGLDGAVTLPGFAEPDHAMASHDVLAMMSVWENCSYALLDAAAHGLGVVASDIGGNREILPARALVAPNEVDRVAEALLEQGTDPSARPRLTRWPTVDDMCERIAATYASVSVPR